MYEDFFGFTSRPFQLAPDARYFFGSKGHTRALAHLTYGLAQGEGFIVITGEVGAGKTTLIDYLLSSLNPQEYRTGRVSTTQLAPGGLLRMILSAFGLPHRSAVKARMLHQLAEFLAQSRAAGLRVFLIVDEVQNLPFPSLEELRMLSNLGTDADTPLQTCLVGQPQFRQVITSAKAEQLRQRVITSYHLGTLQESEIRSYIEHRLRMASWSGRPSFDDQAFSAIYTYTLGVPRRINLFCSRLLLQAYLDESSTIGAAEVDRVADENNAEFAPSAGESRARSIVSEDADDQPGKFLRLFEQRLLVQEKALMDLVDVLDRADNTRR